MARRPTQDDRRPERAVRGGAARGPLDGDGPTRVGSVRSDPPAFDARAYALSKRSRRGRWLRVLLPLMAFAIVGALFLSSRGGVEIGGVSAVDLASLQAGAEVTNMRYSGAMESGAPFSLRADVARPDGPNPNVITLERVTGDAALEGGRTALLSADSGVFERASNEVRLSGDVVLATDDGYEIRTAAIEADIDRNTVESTSRVRIQGPVGELEAARMRLVNEEDIVAVFEGGVTVTLRRLVPSAATGE